MARFILLGITAFIVITFVFVALKGILRRLSGAATTIPPKTKDKIIYKHEGITVLQGEAKTDVQDLPPHEE